MLRDSRTGRLVAVSVVLLAVVAAAWAAQVLWTRTHATPEAGSYALVVTRDGRQLARLGTDDLERLGTRTVVMQNRPETGPPLLSVLSAAGVESFSHVTVVGAGARDTGILELTKAEVSPDVLLDIANRGTAKLCGPKIAYERRVRDVVEIQVR